jgi:hypothetical protein
MVACGLFRVVVVLVRDESLHLAIEVVKSLTEPRVTSLAGNELHVCCGILHCEMSKSGS